MTQMTSLIAVTTVFADSNIYILQSEGGGAYMWDKATYAGIWAKSAGGLGGVFAGFYGNNSQCYHWFMYKSPQHYFNSMYLWNRLMENFVPISYCRAVQ